MLERLLEQRQALALYAAESTLDSLKPDQWDIMKNVVGLLVEEATKYVSLAGVCISDTIPLLSGLKKCLQTDEADAGLV